MEKGILGGQIATTPVVENHPGITQAGGKALVDIMVEHALQYSKIFPGEEVMEVVLSNTKTGEKKTRRSTESSWPSAMIPRWGWRKSSAWS